jgi:cell division inhibitor SulA
MENALQNSFDFDNENAADTRAERRIMEFVCADDRRQQLPLLLSLMGHLSRTDDSRWLTCIGPAFFSKNDCLGYQVHWQRLLQVIPRSHESNVELAERALAAGRSHTVVWLMASAPNEQTLRRLEKAAALGDCQGLIIHGR